MMWDWIQSRMFPQDAADGRFEEESCWPDLLVGALVTVLVIVLLILGRGKV